MGLISLFNSLFLPILIEKSPSNKHLVDAGEIDVYKPHPATAFMNITVWG